MNTPNVMPIHQLLETGTSAAAMGLKVVILQTAVHAWMEGHVAAPGHKLASRADHPDEMPSPPYPNPDSETLQTIVNTVIDEYDEEEAPAAICAAIAAAWRAGRSEGTDCPGCAIQRADSREAKAMREGGMKIEYRLDL